MAALITGDGDTLYILLDSTVHNFLYRAVVAEVDNFGTAALHDTAHDIDGSVVTVEERGGGYEADLVLWCVWCGLLHGDLR
jgi:hypothetical protein